ncbi:MAG: hypothetical protein DME57_06615 [Verrucomicrobia bacterium]|nr:MAG: hypothetical protein DME57_06615 [Verrucomicrobiota bacterium]
MKRSLPETNFLLIFLSWTAVALAASQQNQPTPSSSEAPSDETVSREFLGFTDANTFRGVIDDPDGYANLRSKPDAESAIVTKVKTGERFTFQRHEYDKWCSVKLVSGKSGWMDAQRIMLSFTKDDLPGKPEQGDEIDEQARKHGIDYYEATQGAVGGDVEARKKFFSVSEFADGAAAEEHAGVLGVVVHLIGDDALAAFLQSQPISFQVSVRNSIEGDATWPFRSVGYLQRHFPKTSKIFFHREITDWPSPDGKYAIHKVFSDEYTDEDSVVTRSELIDKATRKRVLDLKSQDNGAGQYKEGDVEWAPDSKGFLFITQTRNGGPETKLYFLMGNSFRKIELPPESGPPAETDPGIANAVYDSDYEVSMHWSNPNTIVREKTYIYKKSIVRDSPYVIERKYEITMTITPDGKIASERKKITMP